MIRVGNTHSPIRTPPRVTLHHRRGQLCEDEPSHNAVEEKIVLLDGCADRARYHSSPQLNWVLLRGQTKTTPIVAMTRTPDAYCFFWMEALRDRGAH